MNTIYVDDQSWAGRALRRGVRWNKSGGTMEWRKDWEEVDIESGEKADKRKFRELSNICNIKKKTTQNHWGKEI